MAKVTKVKIHTSAERQQAGKALRDKCPRASHGEVVLGQGDKRDVVALIKASNEGRLENLVPIRHGRMLQSAFRLLPRHGRDPGPRPRPARRRAGSSSRPAATAT